MAVPWPELHPLAIGTHDLAVRALDVGDLEGLVADVPDEEAMRHDIALVRKVASLGFHDVDVRTVALQGRSERDAHASDRGECEDAGPAKHARSLTLGGRPPRQARGKTSDTATAAGTPRTLAGAVRHASRRMRSKWFLLLPLAGLGLVSVTSEAAEPASRHADIAAALTQGRALALALNEYIVSYTAIPVDLRSLDRLDLPSTTPSVRSFVTGRVRDPWGTVWRVVTDRRHAKAVSIDDDRHYSFRGIERFTVLSAGRDRTFGTKDDLSVDGIGRLWHFPEGLHLQDVFEPGEATTIASFRAAALSDAVMAYVRDHGENHGCPYHFPFSLDELLSKGYINRQLLSDSWGRPWDFCVSPAPDRDYPGTMEVAIRSPGADGAWKTDDDIEGGEGLAPCPAPLIAPKPGCAVLKPDVAEKMPRDAATEALLRIFSCGDAEARRLAYEGAARVEDERFLEPAMKRFETEPLENQARILFLLAKLRDPRALPLVLQELDNPQGPESLQALGNQANLAETIDAYCRTPPGTPWGRQRVLATLVEWAPASDIVLALIEDAFAKADEKSRPELAALALRSQLEPKPLPPYERTVTDVSDCSTIEEWQRSIAPICKREVERLLRPRNRRLFQVANVARAYGVWEAFHNLVATLPPADRVTLWQRVVTVIEGNQSSPEPTSCSPHGTRHALFHALISHASSLLPDDPRKCHRRLDEALIVAESLRSLHGAQIEDPLAFKAIDSIRARARRLAEPEGPRPRVPTRYRRQGVLGGGAKLSLDPGGTYRKVSHSCVIEISCKPRGEDVVEGTYLIERGHVVLTPRLHGGLYVAESYLIRTGVDGTCLENRFCETEREK